MKQVIQDFKSGDLFVDEIPIPTVQTGYVLVRNHYSLISAGTERSTVSTAKASLIGKARQRPDLVKQVLDTYKKEGFASTFMKVRTKLETLKELGYSSSGTVLLSMDTAGALKPGDRVACGGSTAWHAGVISVPQNLVVKIPDSVSLDYAAFTTLGAIAVQGVRQANPRIGESVCVIGLGLLGQISAQVLRSNGCQVFGIDTSPEMVDLARRTSCHMAVVRADKYLEPEMDNFTGGHGFDAVLITAASKTTDPIELATAILRQKGVMVVVGAVPMNVPREPHFYSKELEMKISCSYGPGRYDQTYEEEGHDYPYGYVRWTENRNMGSFVKLLETGDVDVSPLITHTFDIGEAERAYDIVTGKIKEPAIGILLSYPEPEIKRKKEPFLPATTRESALRIGVIGAGSFAQKFLIPNAQNHGELISVADSRGATAKSVCGKFKFRSASSDAEDILSDNSINTVFIATRHRSHGDLVLAALEAGKHVYVEKPLTINEADLSRIAAASRSNSGCRLQVGFNRRFAPLAQEAKKAFHGLSEPLIVNYRINAGFIPNNHWIQTEEGGGRILGEVCHFVDFIQFIIEATPKSVFATCVSSQNMKMKNEDNVAITMSFSDGSIGLISYLACGDKLLEKERIEIFGGGSSFIINDFRTADSYLGGKHRGIKNPGKGHKEEVDLFARSILEGNTAPIPLESLLYTTATTFRILDSLRTGLVQHIDIPL